VKRGVVLIHRAAAMACGSVVPITYVRLGADHGVAPSEQERMITNLGLGVDMIEVPDACHHVMNEHPDAVTDVSQMTAPRSPDHREEP